jgi:hypothetical protein
MIETDEAILNKGKEIIRKLLIDDHLSIEQVTDLLVGRGLERENAYAIVFSVAKEHRAEIIEHREHAKNEDDKQMGFVAFSAMIVAGLVLFGVTDFSIFLGLAFVGALVAYLLEPDKPIVSIPCGFLTILIMYFANVTYFQDRTSFLRIELLIPMGISMVLIMAIYAMLNKCFYANVGNE